MIPLLPMISLAGKTNPLTVSERLNATTPAFAHLLLNAHPLL